MPNIVVMFGVLHVFPDKLLNLRVSISYYGVNFKALFLEILQSSLQSFFLHMGTSWNFIALLKLDQQQY